MILKDLRLKGIVNRVELDEKTYEANALISGKVLMFSEFQDEEIVVKFKVTKDEDGENIDLIFALIENDIPIYKPDLSENCHDKLVHAIVFGQDGLNTSL